MKKLFCTLITLALALTLCFSAFAEEYTYTVAAPNGAPGIALSTLAVDNPEAYTYVAADAITAEFANETADFIIAPINAGAKLYAAGKSTYKLAAVVTWGNLYIASQRDGFALEDIESAGITLFGENTINSSIALYALSANGIEPASVEYLAGAANTQSLLLSDAEAIVLTAEPALTAAKIKNEAVMAYAVNDLYASATGYEGFAQAGLFVKDGADAEMVAWFLKEAEAACAKCTEDVAAVAEACVALEILPNQKVAEAAIPNCAIRFVSAADAKEQVEITAEVDISQYGGDLPADDFYYVAQ